MGKISKFTAKLGMNQLICICQLTTTYACRHTVDLAHHSFNDNGEATIIVCEGDIAALVVQLTNTRPML